jgi:hypothetical protein
MEGDKDNSKEDKFSSSLGNCRRGKEVITLNLNNMGMCGLD